MQTVTGLSSILCLCLALGCLGEGQKESQCSLIVNGNDEWEPMEGKTFDSWHRAEPPNWAVELDRKYSVERTEKLWWQDEDGNVGVCRLNGKHAWAFGIYDLEARQLIAERGPARRSF